MPITTIIIISLLFLNLCLTLIMFWVVHDLLSAVKSLQDTEDVLKHALDLCGEQLPEHTEALKMVLDREYNTCDAMEKWTKTLSADYESISKAYELMRGQYDSIVDMNSKLLECWKGCEERYSQSYEQFKHCSDKLKEISYQVSDLANVSTEDEYYLTLQEACDTVCIDCPYGGLKCHDCPVWQLMYRDVNSDNTEEKTDPFNDIDEEGGDS